MEQLPPDFTFTFRALQRQCFQRGPLVDSWRARYPQLFDEDDDRLARTQPDNHFFEWLCAILLYESTGFMSLIEGYVAKTNARKRKLFAAKVGEQIFNTVDNNQAGLPDLFVYSHNSDDWFFCEVKGGSDVVRKVQNERFELLYKETGKRVRIIKLTEFKP